MKSYNFIDKCKELVVEHHNNSHYANAIIDDVFVVWSCKTLQNNKALLSLPFPGSMYYEITLDGDKETIYFCSYTKTQQINYKV